MERRRILEYLCLAVRNARYLAEDFGATDAEIRSVLDHLYWEMHFRVEKERKLVELTPKGRSALADLETEATRAGLTYALPGGSVAPRSTAIRKRLAPAEKKDVVHRFVHVSSAPPMERVRLLGCLTLFCPDARRLHERYGVPMTEAAEMIGKLVRKWYLVADGTDGYVQTETGARAFDRLMAEAREHGLVQVGLTGETWASDIMVPNVIAVRAYFQGRTGA